MSRIGKLPITLPAGVQVNVNEANVVTVKGKLGELSQAVDPAIQIEVEGNTLTVKRSTEEQDHRAKHGLYRALINNMVIGVSQGYTQVLELIGVGYRAQVSDGLLDLSLGYSHHIYFELPREISVETTAERGKNPTIILKGIDRQLLGQVSAKIRSLRKPEPYKGKGIRYQGEEVRKKAGKAAEK
ncbi:MAG TPA: 50S ribosomal protein L6 [Bacteroidales bacterium]|nr:50S ribosomal protein L6 [Bacteroidales bacterium]